MQEFGKKSIQSTITDLGISEGVAHWNLSAKELAKIAVSKGQAIEVSSGAITVNTGEFTGRSPLDRFIVKDAITRDSVWWGNINLAFDEDKFDALHQKIAAYLSNKELYVRDAYACADEKYRMNI